MSNKHSMPFTHYLITRFNIVQEWFFHSTAENRRTAIQTPEWLQQRFMLFESYCLPSVMQQRNVDFQWLVLFNSETPDEYKEKIEAYERLFPAFTPLYLQPYADEAAFVRSYIRLHTTTPYLITTRMDNDDMLHQDYLATIQQAFSKQQDVVINYKTGLQYDLLEQVMYRWDYDANHYFSRIESLAGNVSTVIGFAHDEIQNLNYCELGTANTPPHVDRGRTFA